MNNNPLQPIEDLIDRQKTAFISTVAEGGYPSTKAMLAPRVRNGVKNFYFTTNTSSQKVAQYRKEPKGCIYFYDQNTFEGVMLRGTMEVLEDAATKEMIWREGDTMYYKGGVTDPDYCVLKFTAQVGRYYTNFESEDFLAL